MNSMLEYNGYHVTVTYDADELFIGEVLMYEFPQDCTNKF